MPDRAARKPSEPAPSTTTRLFTLFGTLVGPTTVLTALLFYFGRLHAFAFFDYFGVNFTAFDLTATDYIVRSADGLFVPLTAAAAAGLAGLWAYRIGVARLPRRVQEVIARLLRPLVVGLGLLLLAVAGVAIVDQAPFEQFLAVPGLCMAGGVVLLAVASRIPPGRPRPGREVTRPSLPVAAAEWAAVFLLASIGLFWAVGDYAYAVGRGRGYEQAAGLAAWPDVVLYSEKGLNIRGAGAQETPCTSPGTAYEFRYDGLKLVFQGGGQYLFLPSEWTSESGTALLLPRSDTVRIEFETAGGVREPGC